MTTNNSTATPTAPTTGLTVAACIIDLARSIIECAKRAEKEPDDGQHLYRLQQAADAIIAVIDTGNGTDTASVNDLERAVMQKFIDEQPPYTEIEVPQFVYDRADPLHAGASRLHVERTDELNRAMLLLAESEELLDTQLDGEDGWLNRADAQRRSPPRPKGSEGAGQARAG